ncbi:hypothetical protein PUN28_016928 [Cardiocondyla obscurior]|uniref:Uncharacterized protein n=1 Tax=Cardiocondyla obscurior TaxID=286306 RepID=A0AAW2EMA3_9HYME
MTVFLIGIFFFHPVRELVLLLHLQITAVKELDRQFYYLKKIKIETKFKEKNFKKILTSKCWIQMI